MGDSEITIARNYAKGAGGCFAGIDALPLTGEYTTYALQQGRQARLRHRLGRQRHGWSTGTKTYNGALGIDVNGEPQKTILELAKEQGFATGDITTSEIQDATPAALFSHISERDCYGPDGDGRELPGRDAREGRPRLDHRAAAGDPARRHAWAAAPRRSRRPRPRGDYKGKTLEVQAKERGYQIVRTASELAGVTKADQDAPVLGLFADGNMPVRWTGPPRSGRATCKPAAKCTDNPEHGAEVPKLADMTQQGHRPAAGTRRREGQGLLPAGRGRIDRQARPRRRPLRTDRRDGRLRRGGAAGARLRRSRTATRWSSRPPTTATPARSSSRSAKRTCAASPRTPSCPSSGSATSCTPG